MYIHALQLWNQLKFTEEWVVELHDHMHASWLDVYVHNGLASNKWMCFSLFSKAELIKLILMARSIANRTVFQVQQGTS